MGAGKGWPYLRKHDILAPPAQCDAQEVVDGRGILQAHRPVLFLLRHPAQHHVPSSLWGDVGLGRRRQKISLSPQGPCLPGPGTVALSPLTQARQVATLPETASSFLTPRKALSKEGTPSPLSPGWSEGAVLKAGARPGNALLQNFKLTGKSQT